MEFQLKGWPAVMAVVVGIGAVVGYRGWLHNNPEISAQLKDRLEFDLIAELAGSINADAKATQAAIQRGDLNEAERLGKGMLQRKVEINDFDLRGSGDDIIVRAGYTLHGPEGPEMKTGYYRYSYSALTGWHYQYETTAWSWRMKLF